MVTSSADLEREALAARQKLAATLDQLRDNLAPGKLMDEIVGRAGGPQGVSLFKRVESGIRRNPIPAMLLGVGSTLFMGSKWNRKPSAVEKSNGAGQPSLEFGNFADKSIRDNVASVGHSVADTAYHTLKLRAAEKIEEITKAATAGVGAASHHVLGVAEDVLDRTFGKVSAKVEERPLAFSVIALAVGAAVGAALLRSSSGKDT